MLVIGNGTSRKKIDLNRYVDTKIGCNAIFRDYHVDHLVCCDKRMVKQAISAGKTPVYTRQKWLPDFDNQDVLGLPNLPYEGNKRQDDPFNWGSGPYAILLATTLCKYIKIIGFDLCGTNQGTTNNIYANTNGYKSLFDEAVDWSYWVYQISKIFEHNPDKKFHLYNEKDWEVPEKWKFDNIKVDILDNL